MATEARQLRGRDLSTNNAYSQRIGSRWHAVAVYVSGDYGIKSCERMFLTRTYSPKRTVPDVVQHPLVEEGKSCLSPVVRNGTIVPPEVARPESPLILRQLRNQGLCA